MTEFMLILNLTALNAVIIHSIITKGSEKKYKKPQISFKAKKKREMTDEEKRDAEILNSISNYNGKEVSIHNS